MKWYKTKVEVEGRWWREGPLSFDKGCENGRRRRPQRYNVSAGGREESRVNHEKRKTVGWRLRVKRG